MGDGKGEGVVPVLWLLGALQEASDTSGFLDPGGPTTQGELKGRTRTLQKTMETFHGLWTLRLHCCTQHRSGLRKGGELFPFFP